MTLSKNDIVNLLATNDKAICRALIVLTARQTVDEQTAEHTRHNNGRGFRPAHAKMGTSMAKFFQRNGYLTPKQIAYWRRTEKSGYMRIGIYAGQLLEEAAAKAAKTTDVVPPATKFDDYQEENEKWRREQAVKSSGDFNEKWAEHKNDYARREAQQEQLAFEWKMNNR